MLFHLTAHHSLGQIQSLTRNSLGQDYVVNYNKDIGDTFSEIYRRAIINHEVAHMWFGDLVTQVSSRFVVCSIW